MNGRSRTERLLKPLLAHHDDLLFATGFLIVKPVEHLVRGIILDRTSLGGFFHARWAVNETFVIRDSLALNYGEWVFEDMSPTGFFELSEADMSARLCEKIEAVTLPRLRAIATCGDYLDFQTRQAVGNRFRQPLPPSSHQYFRLLLAAGDFQTARAVRDANIKAWATKPWFSRPDMPDEDVTIRTLSELLDAKDHGEIARQFRAREAVTARKMKLEKIWQPTPFPFEADGWRS